MSTDPELDELNRITLRTPIFGGLKVEFKRKCNDRIIAEASVMVKDRHQHDSYIEIVGEKTLTWGGTDFGGSLVELGIACARDVLRDLMTHEMHEQLLLDGVQIEDPHGV